MPDIPAWLAGLTALAGAVATLLTTRYTRMARVERRQDVLEYRNRRLWVYCRQLMDHIYQGKPPPPPPWPDDIDDPPEPKGA